MKSKSRIETVTETTREVSFLVERRAGKAFFGETCGECSGRLLALNEAVRYSGLGWEEIIRLLKKSEVHAAETVSGEIYICAESLAGFKRTKKKL